MNEATLTRLRNRLARASTRLRTAWRHGSPQGSGRSAASGSGLWLDRDDAGERIEAARMPEDIKAIARSLRRDGVALVKGAHEPGLCREVVADYDRYVRENADYVRQNLDALGREKRLVNFHLWSDAAARIGTANRIMRALDFVFAGEAAIYTSLTFKYGSQQPVHRDTPHFATWPGNCFVGAWTALEPVAADAGPLFYHPGAHRFAVDPRQFMVEAERRLPDGTPEQQQLLALDLYNGEIIRRSPTIADPVTLEMDIGDTVIWHPEMPHGGLPAQDPMRTRWSIVFHCSPVAVQVHQHDRFFTHTGSAAPADRYGYRSSHGRKIALAGGVAFM